MTSPLKNTAVVKKATPTLPNHDTLFVELYEIGRQAFSVKHRVVIFQLLCGFKANEILAAYREFMDGRDGFLLPLAAEDFCDGSGRHIMLARRRRLRKRRQPQVLLDKNGRPKVIEITTALSGQKAQEGRRSGR